MAKCGNFVCSEDALTYDEIVPPCISAGVDMCVSCKTVTDTRAHDIESFNDNPLAKLFAIEKSSKQEVNEIWRQITTQCGIKKPSMVRKTPTYVVEPDLQQVSRDIQSISKRISSKLTKRKVGLWLIALQRVASMAQRWNMTIKLGVYKRKCDLLKYMKGEILDALKNVKCGGSHNPREMPIGIAIFLRAWAKSDNTRFKKVLNFLLRGEGCMEGKIQVATEMAI